ncbi:hypothetical protein PDE_02467 [Penicillium oxalicum 114-2]|uniref:Uncharacterized protein n=1 Tax=Penicillium oxalicum (strain 114-2 / CGMCC 5302) TaxID=933388 RepID=S7ZBA1_PENO1|nr:hypothetical protein PDE_02467 [Penicillium oxalicum 114-2]
MENRGFSSILFFPPRLPHQVHSFAKIRKLLGYSSPPIPLLCWSVLRRSHLGQISWCIFTLFRLNTPEEFLLQKREKENKNKNNSHPPSIPSIEIEPHAKRSKTDTTCAVKPRTESTVSSFPVTPHPYAKPYSTGFCGMETHAPERLLNKESITFIEEVGAPATAPSEAFHL